MFCTKCGASLEDGAKFCTSCGAPTRFAQVSAPAEEAPAAPAVQPVVPTPAAPAAEWTAPAAPAQPAQPQQSVWSAPAAPAQPAQPRWQQPQPAQPQQQWQQQWQQPQQPQQPQQWQQPQQQWQQPVQPQSTRQQPAPTGGAHTTGKKKSKAGLIIGIIAAVLVLVVGVGGFVWPGFFRGGKGGGSADGGSLSGGGSSSGISASFVKKATPEEYFQAVENNSVDNLADHIATAYDNLFLSNVTDEDMSVSGKLSLEPGDKVRELLLDAIGDSLDQINPGDDLKWLKSVAASYEVSRKSDLLGFSLGILLNGSDIVHANGAMQEGGDLVLAVPELSDRSFSVPLENMDLSSINLGSNFMLSSLLNSLDIEDAENVDLDAVSKAMPDADTVRKLLTRYLNEAVDLVEKVERSDGKLTVADVSAEYTVLTATIDAETLQAIVDKLGPELKEDKDIKKIILDLAGAAGQDGDARYAEFTEKLDSKLQELVDKLENDIDITLYLDKKTSEVHGRIVESGRQKIELLMPEDSGRFGLLVRFTDVDGERLNLMGSGKRNGDKLTGDLDLQVDGEYYGVVGLDGFDVEKAKEASFVGGLVLKPSASFWSLITDQAEARGKEIPETIMSLLDSMEFHLDLNTSKDKASVSLTVSNGSDKFFTLSVDGAKGAAKKISPAEGISANEWADDITLDKLEKVVAAIEKAGVPAAYTDLLDDALQDSFG